MEASSIRNFMLFVDAPLQMWRFIVFDPEIHKKARPMPQCRELQAIVVVFFKGVNGHGYMAGNYGDG